MSDDLQEALQAKVDRARADVAKSNAMDVYEHAQRTCMSISGTATAMLLRLRHLRFTYGIKAQYVCRRMLWMNARAFMPHPGYPLLTRAFAPLCLTRGVTSAFRPIKKRRL